VLDPVPPAREGNVGATIRAVTNVLVGNYENSIGLETSPLTLKLMAMRHEINMGGPLGLWLSILGRTRVTFESWAAAFEKGPRLPTRVTERVYEVMASRTPGFWNVVRVFMSEFQMFYVPRLDGPGKFVRSDEKVEEEGASFKVSATAVSLADGSQRLLQVGGVLMLASSAPTTRAQTSDPSPRVMAHWPEDLLSGHIHEVTPPWWLLDAEGNVILDAEFTDVEEEAEEELDLDLAQRNVRVKEARQWRLQVEDVSTDIMTEMCKVLFAELQLAGSTAALTLPLDFRMNSRVGKRVEVEIKSKDGASATFTAFLSGITHTLDLRNGTSLNSSTQIRLTHAKY